MTSEGKAAMQINKNTWHYKLWYVWNREKLLYNGFIPTTTTLCTYCRQVFLCALARTIYVVMLIATFMSALILFGVFISLLYNFFALAPIACAASLISIALLVYYVIRLTRGKKEPTSLAGKWFQAKKQKICPVIEFTDDV